MELVTHALISIRPGHDICLHIFFARQYRSNNRSWAITGRAPLVFNKKKAFVKTGPAAVCTSGTVVDRPLNRMPVAWTE
jgi:hypothetical protein